jgi:hypothetical protein
VEDLLKAIYHEWATVTAHPQAFLAALGLGLLIGWGAAWIILKQRLIHHREMLDHYKEQLAKKGPKPKAAPAKSPLPLFSPRNMFVGVAVLIIVILVPAYSILKLSGPSAEILYRATLQFAALSPWKARGEMFNRFNVQFNNVGNFPALHLAQQVSGRIEDHELNATEIKADIDKLKSEVADIDKHAQSPTQVGVGQGSIVTLPGTTATDEEFAQAVPKGAKLFYVFWVSNYDDEIREGKSYWHAELCGYFVGNLNFWHNCGDNKASLVRDKRYP